MPKVYSFAAPPHNNYPCADAVARQMFRVKVRKDYSSIDVWRVECALCKWFMVVNSHKFAMQFASLHANSYLHKKGGWGE